MIFIGLVLALGAPAERSLLADLERIDRALVTAEHELVELTAARESVQKEIARLEADQAAVTIQKETAYSHFKKRLRVLAQMPAGARLAVLGGSRSLVDYLQITRLLRWIATHDRRLHEHYVEAGNRLGNLTATLEARRAQLLALENRQRERRDELAQRRQERLDLLTTVAEDAAARSRISREHSAAGLALAETLRKLSPAGRQSEDFAKNRGRLPWPAVGPVDVKFGQRLERTTGTTVTQNGLDIRAKTGSRVQAVAAGDVVFTNWLKGYGQVVILDHGGNYHTLVAHLGAITVAAGETVDAGSALGTVGDTGSLKGPLLYFELRHRGLPIDPLPWLRR